MAGFEVTLDSLDDPTYVVRNPHLRGGLTWEGIRWAFIADFCVDLPNADYWQPVTFLSRMLDIECFGFDPAMHHLMNLVVHIANTLLLFHVLGRMTTRGGWPPLGGGEQASLGGWPSPRDGHPQRMATTNGWQASKQAGAVEMSAWVAALFAIHPLHVESVAWVTERKDVLSGFFWICCLWAYLRYVEAPVRRRYGCMMVLFTLGLMSKPMVVTLPFVLLLLDFWPLGRMQNYGIGVHSLDGNVQRFVPLHLFLEKWPLFVLSIVSCVVTLKAQSTFLIHPSMGDVLTQVVVSYTSYLSQTIAPVHLAVYYPRPTTGFPLGQILGSIVVITLLSFWTIRERHRCPQVFVGWWWFVGTLVPVIGLNDIAQADRFTYLPLIGLFLAVAWGVPGFAMERPWRLICLRVAAAAWVAILMLLSWIQTGYWRNSVTLLEHALHVTHDNWLMRRHLGVALMQKGNLDAAMVRWKEGLKIKPDDPGLLVNLGVALARKGQTREATAYFQHAIQIHPDHVEAHNNWGAVLTELGRLDEANRHFIHVLRNDPSLGRVRVNLANNLFKQGKLDEAIRQYAKAMETLPEDAEVYYGLASCLVLRGKIKEAIPGFELTLVIAPNHVMARYHLADCFFELGQLEVAARHLEIALEGQPSLEQARKLLERVRSAVPLPSSPPH